MKFNGAAFTRFLNNIGQDVLWSASYSCPCTNPHSGAPDPRCPLCVGKGVVWDKPIKTVVGIASQKTQERWAKMGFYETGDMVLSIPENSPIWARGGQFDRVVALNSLDGFSEVLVRGSPTEKMRIPVHSISRVFWRHPVTAAIVEGGIPTIGEDGVPVFASGEPPAGMTYSITGDRYSEYFMLDQFPVDRNQHRGTVKLPKNVVLRKWSLYGHNARTATSSY